MELTKEVLVELGWKFHGGFYWELTWNTDCDEISNRGLSWRLNFVNPNRALHIDCYERNAFEWERCYQGPCHTVTDLLTIMGMLKLENKSELYTENDASWTDNTESTERISEDYPN
jgi:hypothetical protein